MKQQTSYFKEILKLIRPSHWLKNMFVFIPIFFGGEIFDTDALIAGLTVFFAFSFMASSVYCYNDIVDADDDRRHPIKFRRPVAYGTVSVRSAYALMTIMLALSAGLSLMLSADAMPGVIFVLGFYYILNLAYCSKLKQYAIVDVCIVAFGFVLRLVAGGLAADITLSKWIVLMTFLLTLFLSFAKRRDDVLRMNITGEAPRKNTTRYNITFINQAITITASTTIVCYIMYTTSPEVAGQFNVEYLYLTMVFVLIGLLRYIQIAVVDEKSGDPVKIILHDQFSQIIVVAWILTFLIMIYIL